MPYLWWKGSAMNWMFVSPKIHTSKPESPMWLYLEVEPLGGNWAWMRSWGWVPWWNWCSYKGWRDQISLYPPLCQVRVLQEGSHLQTMKWALTRHWICPYLDNRFPSFQNYEKCLLLKPHSLQDFVTAAQANQDRQHGTVLESDIPGPTHSSTINSFHFFTYKMWITMPTLWSWWET